MTMRDLDAIIAIAHDGAIGQKKSETGLPWHFKEDMIHFRLLTKGRTLIMGRKTFESLPGVLPGRKHLVITRSQPDFVHENVSFSDHIPENLESPIVIGGPTLLRSLMPRLRTVYLTLIEKDYPAANVRDLDLLNHLLRFSTHTVLTEFPKGPVTFLRLDMDEDA